MSSPKGNLACKTDLPILMLYNVDPTWPQDDIRERRKGMQLLTEALNALGHPVTCASLKIADLTSILQLQPADQPGSSAKPISARKMTITDLPL